MHEAMLELCVVIVKGIVVVLLVVHPPEGVTVSVVAARGRIFA